MTRWKSVLAGAVIGFLEAAGSENERRALHRPLAVVRYEDGDRARQRAPRGLWFLEPIARPRPDAGGVRKPGPLLLERALPLALARRFAARFGGADDRGPQRNP